MSNIIIVIQSIEYLRKITPLALTGINQFAHVYNETRCIFSICVELLACSPNRSDRNLGEVRRASFADSARRANCMEQEKFGSVPHGRACAADERSSKPGRMHPLATEHYNLGRFMAFIASCASAPGS